MIERSPTTKTPRHKEDGILSFRGSEAEWRNLAGLSADYADDADSD